MPRHTFVVALFLLFLSGQVVSAQVLPSAQYLSPLPGAALVSPGTTLAVRLGPPIDARTANSALFKVVGSQSGEHRGSVVLADDKRTVVFKPAQPFAPGETVRVTLAPSLRTVAGDTFVGMTYSFSISSGARARSATQAIQDRLDLGEAARPSPVAPTAAPVPQKQYITIPGGFLPLTITVAANGTAPGYVFLSSFSFTGALNPPMYNVILDNVGDPVYYERRSTTAVDFKRQPNGLLTYFDGPAGAFLAMNSSYTIVDSFQAGNGYPSTDPHDLQLVPGTGNALLMIYDQQIMDLSQVVPGGQPTATVVGLVVQELDPAKNVVFEWRSWDHFLITDTVESLTGARVDYVHGNAVEPDTDGNLLISSRHLDEVTKINRQTGAIIWRLGGKNNQFAFLDGDGTKFYHQHDIRRLANGNITLFDNRTNKTPAYSRMVEFALDEAAKTAHQVWEGRNTPDTYSAAMGSGQRLPNGNSMIGWGFGNPPAGLELKPNGTKAFELTLPPNIISYRVFRFPWQGYPTWDPTLAMQQQGNTTTLFYSWNGATDVASYQIYGGTNAGPVQLLTTQARTGFETQTVLQNPDPRYCYFVVMPVDGEGHTTRLSNRVYTGTPCAVNNYWFPIMAGP